MRRDSSREAITLEATTPADVRYVFWFDGTALIGKISVNEGALTWRPSTEGLHLIRVIDDHGRAAERDVRVQFTQ
jgi:membrane carboxypeptidase/penicillin-binding protein PbpC